MFSVMLILLSIISFVPIDDFAGLDAVSLNAPGYSEIAALAGGFGNRRRLVSVGRWFYSGDL